MAEVAIAHMAEIDVDNITYSIIGTHGRQRASDIGDTTTPLSRPSPSRSSASTGVDSRMVEGWGGWW